MSFNSEFKNILYEGMKNQVEYFEKFYRENKDTWIENLNILELNDNLNVKLKEVIEELNNIIGECFSSSKNEFLESINRDMILRDSDSIDKNLLEAYNTLFVKRLASDIQERLVEDLFNDNLNKKYFENFFDKTLIRGNQTAANRMKLITNDIINRASSTGKLQAMKDYGLNKVFVRPHGGNICEFCMELYEKNPHSIHTIEKFYPAHTNCSCTLKKVYLEHPSENPVEQERYVNLVHFYSENS